MDSITSTAAKATLNALLAQVERSGKPVTITNHGRPVAILSPVAPRSRPFGQLKSLVVPDSFDEPLSIADLDAWDGVR